MVTGVFTPIIERNCVVPVSREEIFHTVFDNQAVVEFPVYQGESRWTKDNILLGSVEVPVPRRRAGEVQVNCRFSYDINGLLEVDVHVPATGQQRQLVVVDKEGLSPEKIEERRAELAKLKIHPRDTDGVRATLARAERCYENSIGEAREFIGGVMLDFERILARQDPRACEAARLELNSILDEFEGHSLL
jgi:molecular chaperone HscC